VGLLLPCNVTIEWIADGRTGVRPDRSRGAAQHCSA
jgi:hypothetical protein